MSSSLRDSLQFFGLRLDPAADISRMIRELEWLARPGGPLETKTPLDRRGQEAVEFIDQAQRIAVALEHIRSVPGADAKVRWLRKRVDRMLTHDATAQDYLLEIEIAGRLAQDRLLVRFGEPDIVADVPSFGLVSLECKRPRAQAGVEREVRKAAKQIERAGRAGIIVVSLEALLHPPKTVGQRTQPVQWQARTYETLTAIGQRRFTALTDAMEPALEKHCSRPHVAGALALGIWTGWSGIPPSSYSRDWLCHPIVNLSFPKAAGLLRRIARALFRSGPA